MRLILIGNNIYLYDFSIIAIRYVPRKCLFETFRDCISVDIHKTYKEENDCSLRKYEMKMYWILFNLVMEKAHGFVIDLSSFLVSLIILFRLRFAFTSLPKSM